MGSSSGGLAKFAEAAMGVGCRCTSYAGRRRAKYKMEVLEVLVKAMCSHCQLNQVNATTGLLRASMIAPSCQPFIEARVAVSCSHSLRVLRDICLRFRQLMLLTVMDLPCKLTVDVWSPVVVTFQHLQYLRLMVSRGNSVFEECWALQQWLQQQLPCITVCITAGVE